MKSKKIPMRRCTGCRESFPKKELLRIVKNAEGDIFLDRTGKANGRGAYICKNPACLAACIKTKALSRAFETNVSAQAYEKLKEDLDS